MESHLRHKSHKMHDFCFHNLEWYPQRYPQTFWLPSDFPGFDGGFSTPVDLFRWLDLFRSQNRGGGPYMYISDRATRAPFSVLMEVTHEWTRPHG